MSRKSMITITPDTPAEITTECRRIMAIAGRYAGIRIQEELAACRDATPATLKLHYDRGNAAWRELEGEITKLLKNQRPTSVETCTDCAAPVHEGPCPVPPVSDTAPTCDDFVHDPWPLEAEVS